VWMKLFAPLLSLLPRRWRDWLPGSSTMPWVPATIISGSLEAVCGLIGLVYWYSYSVTGWAQKSLFAQLRTHPGTGIPVGTEGFFGLLLVAAHPLTWVIAAFSLEGIVRVCAAAFTGEILGTFPLFIIDRILALFMRSESTAKDSGDSSRAGGTSFFSALRQRYLIATLPLIPDELHYTSEIPNNFLRYAPVGLSLNGTHLGSFDTAMSTSAWRDRHRPPARALSCTFFVACPLACPGEPFWRTVPIRLRWSGINQESHL
jgi:hypothetical protein